ncbi:MAG: HAD hydrolase family protein [Bacilli bacterium]|nr:HAD hydrolase family protein [Bacilli bacterium]
MNLLVTDFDGTLFDDNYENNIKFIEELNNTDLVIATGRNYPNLKQDLKIKCNYYICNDGGYILDKDCNLLYRNYINKETVATIYSRILKLGYEDYFIDNINEFSKEIIDNANKISVRIQNNYHDKDTEYLLEGLDNVYAYVSSNWINILSVESKKSNAINYITNKKNYNNIYIVGNDINDYDMLKMYNGYLIGNNSDFNTINNFLELKNIIKND